MTDSIYSADNPLFASLQQAIREFREKAAAAVKTLKELRERVKTLESDKSALERSLADARRELEEQSAMVLKFRDSKSGSHSIDVGERLLYFSADEREALERQINDLLERLNTHLG